MEAVNKNRGASEPSAKMETTTPLSVVSSEDKNISVETPFHDSKAGYQPGVQKLSYLEDGVQGCANPLQAPFQKTNADCMRETVRKFRESLMFSVPFVVREQAVDTLNLLIRFDASISLDESRVLMDAVKIIRTKGVGAA